METIMHVDTETGEIMKEYKVKSAKAFALKLAIALAGSRTELDDFDFFDAYGVPLHAIEVGDEMALIYRK
ncbi:MAG TPA: hypothetical protein EYN38_01245 [Flavobacteriales bacterium]|nr:hypothetical protein [Flavobacteriales bacterium]HIA12670.1 hypothetical protein [Flavobacteriales bacterium]HIO71711.1 hypothetical protein [Flavobacteriales bacterium]